MFLRLFQKKIKSKYYILAAADDHRELGRHLRMGPRQRVWRTPLRALPVASRRSRRRMACRQAFWELAMAGKWKGVTIDYSRMLGQLKRFQEECKAQHLGVECEMASVLLSVVEHAKDDWSHFDPQRFKRHLRRLRRALECDEAI